MCAGAISTPVGVVIGTIATNNSTSVLWARILDRRPPLAAAAVAVADAHACVTVPVLPPTSPPPPPLTPAAICTARLRKVSMRTAMAAPDSETRNDALALHGSILRNTPTVQTQIQDGLDKGMNTEETGKFLSLLRKSIAVHSSKKKKKKTNEKAPPPQPPSSSSSSESE